jgi:hypothetical protein
MCRKAVSVLLDPGAVLVSYTLKGRQTLELRHSHADYCIIFMSPPYEQVYLCVYICTCELM